MDSRSLDFVNDSIKCRFFWDIVVALLIGGAMAAPTAAFLYKKLPAKAFGGLIGVALIGFKVRTLLTFDI